MRVFRKQKDLRKFFFFKKSDPDNYIGIFKKKIFFENSWIKKSPRMVKLIFDTDFKSSLRISFFRRKSWENSSLSLKNWQIHPKKISEFFFQGQRRWKKKLTIDSASSYSEVYGEFFRFLLSWVLLSNVRSSICDTRIPYFLFGYLIINSINSIHRLII